MSEVDYASEPGGPRLKTSRLPLILFLVVLLAGGGVALWLLLRSTPQPRVVLVAVRGCSGPCAEAMRARMGRRLRHHGLERPGEEEAVEIPEDAVAGGLDALVDVARSAEAGHVVLFELEPQRERPGLTEGKTFVTAKVSARVRTLDEEGTGGPHDVVFSTEGTGRRDALRRVGVAGVDTLADAAIAHVAASDAIAAFLDDPSVREMDLVDKVRTAQKSVPIREQALDRYFETCEEAAAQVEKGEPEVRCVSDGCAEEYVMGVSPDGSHVLLKVETGAPVARLITRSTVSRAEPPERLDWVPLGGGERKTLATAQNFYSWGALSDDGSTAAMIEKGSRRYGLVVVDVASGERTVLMSVAQPHRLSDPVPSPDGSLFAVTYRETRRGPPHPAIAAKDGSGLRPDRRGRPVGWVRASRAPDVEPELMLAVLAANPLGGDKSLTLIDPKSGAALATVGDAEHSIDRFAGAEDGALWVSWRGLGECGIGRHEVATGETTWTPTRLCVARPKLRGGRMVGTARASASGDPSSGDAEVVEVDLQSGEIAVLTKNGLRDRYPAIAGDGTIVVERMADENYERFPRVLVCTLGG